MRRTQARAKPLGEPTGPVLVAEVVAEQRIVARLEHDGATSAGRARALSELSAAEVAGLEALLRAGVVREAGPGAYYVDERAYPAQGSAKSSLAALLFALLVVLTLVLAGIGVLIAL